MNLDYKFSDNANCDMDVIEEYLSQFYPGTADRFFNKLKEKQAKEYVLEISRKHKKARHVAFAYVLPNTARYSDDGEPSGTAGLPLLNSIQRRSMQNTIVVVVRYFGGTLLGKGGLIRAYGKAAGLALDNILSAMAQK